ncbi:uncharacterized protein LOC105262553 [Musca domestica]|uniref:Uncharacterized protein LOC105262553 n=1 Tax=Musca domestica TaxID=7370 RepID=A0A1I8NJB4_MUSDO|nr:uncharacterized protein LOC105262553 [Musca domestica]
MKCRLQCLLFALMLGRAFSMIMVNTGGVHDKYSVETKTGTTSPAAGGSAGTAANTGATTVTTSAGQLDLSALTPILGSLLSSAGSSTAATGSATGATSVTPNLQNPTTYTPSLFNKFGGAGGGLSIFQLLKPNSIAPPRSNFSLRDITEMVTTIYNTINNSNNARFSHDLPQFYPYAYKQYYNPYEAQYPGAPQLYYV